MQVEEKYTVLISKDLQNLPKNNRLHLLNACVGFKSANLLVSKSPNNYNVAIFSSVMHLNSDPALIGVVFRLNPTPRNTYLNIKSNAYFTVNQISESLVIPAHLSSAKYSEDVSEFEKVGLIKEFVEPYSIPFVHGSPIQLSCKYENEYMISESNSVLVVAKIEGIRIKQGLLSEDGWLNFEKSESVAISGLDSYYKTELLHRLENAKPMNG